MLPWICSSARVDIVVRVRVRVGICCSLSFGRLRTRRLDGSSSSALEPGERPGHDGYRYSGERSDYKMREAINVERGTQLCNANNALSIITKNGHLSGKHVKF